MPRKIILLKAHSSLAAAWNARTFGPAEDYVPRIEDRLGINVDRNYRPVALPGVQSLKSSLPVAEGFNYNLLSRPDTAPTFAIRADVPEEAGGGVAVATERTEDVVGVFADPTISGFGNIYCGDEAVGDATDVERQLGVDALRSHGLTGKNVRVAVVDTGIDGSKIKNIAGGWAPVQDYQPGSTGPDHGSMVAWDTMIAAPDSKILDYALLKSTNEGLTGFLSDALAAFADLQAMIDQEPGPLIVNCSWGLYNRNEDAPVGSPENYSANPDHPFNQIVGSLVASGADLFFAAGNCGEQCPADRCGTRDIGPARSIHGANSHPDAISVAAVTVHHERLGYSSQGPGALYKRKPDISAYSHFDGSHIFSVDSGTSAASPVAAGVVAAIRQNFDNQKVPPASLKGLVQRTAINIGRVGWDHDTGYGVINGANIVKALVSPAPDISRTPTHQRVRNRRRGPHEVAPEAKSPDRGHN